MFCIHINVYNSTKVRHLNFIFKMKTYACTYIFALYYTIAIIIALQVIFKITENGLQKQKMIANPNYYIIGM